MSNSIHILSTRPLSAEIITQAQQDNICIDVISFIETESVADKVKTEIEAVYAQQTTVIFTSMNAVEAVAAFANGKSPQWNIFCIGEATATLVEQYFGDVIAGTATSAAALADVVINADAKDVIFFCGDQRRPELPDKLAAANVSVKEIIVYRTISRPQQIERTYNGILFFSPSAVESFFAANTVDAETILFAIGNTTSQTIRAFSNNELVVAERADKESLAHQAVEHFKLMRTTR